MIDLYMFFLFVLGIVFILYGLYVILAKKPLITRINQPIFKYHKNFVGKTIIIIGFIFIVGGVIALVYFEASFIITLALIISFLEKRARETSSLNSISFDNFSEFYGKNVSENEELSNKLNKICSMIENGERDIKKIAEASSCTMEECVFNLKYLKNTKRIEEFNIDTYNMKLYTLSSEDEKLLKKYRSFLYFSHSQFDTIVQTLAKQENKSSEEEKETVFNELKYLDDKKLLKGISFNEVDKKLIYYDISKNTTKLKTVHCPNCGALIDINIGSKERCIYCNTIIIGDDYHD